MKVAEREDSSNTKAIKRKAESLHMHVDLKILCFLA